MVKYAIFKIGAVVAYARSDSTRYFVPLPAVGLVPAFLPQIGFRTLSLQITRRQHAGNMLIK